MILAKIKKYGSWEQILFAIYVALFVIAPIMSNKLIAVMGVKLLIGTLMITIANGFIDVINNNFGQDKARQTVVAAFIARAFIYGLVGLSFLIPPFKEPAGFQDIMMSGFRIFLAGELSTVIGQILIDIPVFAYMKQRFDKFWLSYNISNMVGKLISIPVFMVLAFAGTDRPIFQLILGSYSVWLVTSLVLTPLFSGLVRICKK